MALTAKQHDITSMTTMGVPVLVDEYIEADSVDDLDRLRSAGLLSECVALGGGSNMLFTTSEYHGRILHPAMHTISVEPDGCDDGDVLVTADCGVVLDDLSAMTCAWGLWGLENLSHIPGQIGGAAVQNVGAYGTELADVVKKVSLYDVATGERTDLSREQMHYGYRTSLLKEPRMKGRYIVLSVTMRLSRKPQPRLGYKALAEAVKTVENLTPSAMREAVGRIRGSKLPDPKVTGSVGSYFKNPVVTAEAAAAFTVAHPEAPAFNVGDGHVKLSAAWLIDHAGCKPLSCGGAALWQSQPLVLVNATGHATAADVLELERMVAQKVMDTFGIEITCEVVKL